MTIKHGREFSMIKGKKILIFSPSFFGYGQAIKARLEDFYNKVTLFDERPSNGFWGKALLRKNRNIIQYIIRKHYGAIFRQIKNDNIKYDYILIVNPEAMPIDFLILIKERYLAGKVLLYMWDSLRNRPHAKEYFPYCDRILTFDSEDIKVNERLELRPLFYLNEYSELGVSNNFEYDVCFIGSGHSDRFAITSKIEKSLNEFNFRMFNYLYLQSKKLYYYNLLTNPAFKNTRSDFFKYTSLTSNEMMDIIRKSKIVLDIQGPTQTGLTIRTIEALGSKRKIITTNPYVKGYDFYNPDNILVIDRQTPIIPKSFIESPYKEIDQNIYTSYSLDSWLEYIIR